MVERRRLIRGSTCSIKEGVDLESHEARVEFFCGAYRIRLGACLACRNPSGGIAVCRSRGDLFSRTGRRTYPDSWKPLTFHKIDEHTEYSLVEDDGTVVVKAVSRGSSSGLTREVTIDPKLYPIVEWRWKIENVLQKGDVTTKEGDDYPARLYITFAYDESKIDFLDQAQYELARVLHGKYPPTGAITYIWESRSPIGTIVPNPYTDRVKMIVIESGEAKVGQWVAESRNLYEDYQKAFGDDPPPVSGVAVMTDTDNTRESAVAYFGDITFKKAAD